MTIDSTSCVTKLAGSVVLQWCGEAQPAGGGVLVAGSSVVGGVELPFLEKYQHSKIYWSALATTPASISARAGAKEAINFIETCLVFVSPTIKLPLLSNIGS
jgi:hypothetical protein